MSLVSDLLFSSVFCECVGNTRLVLGFWTIDLVFEPVIWAPGLKLML